MRIYVTSINEVIKILCLNYPIIDDFDFGEMKIQLYSIVQFLVKIFSDTLTQK